MGLGMGMMALKNKAATWLEFQDGEASVQKLAGKNRKLGKENANLKRQVEALEKRLAGLENILAETGDSTEELPA
jgi:cell division protein FtsB